MPTAIEAVWAEPRAADCPQRLPRDYWLVGALLLSAVLEGLLRPDVVWRPFVTVLAAGLAVTLLWRRTHPLAVVAVVCGATMLFELMSWLAGLDQSAGLFTMFFILLLPYSLYRWASGREVIYGTLILVAMFTGGIVADYKSVGETVAAFVFLFFPGVLGASVRFWTTSQHRELDRVRSREREQLARELHDTVAHHVSAMVIRAQAGRAVAASAPQSSPEALAALELIEAEGAKTLAEMRFMVGALREPGRVELSPLSGVADIERLAASVREELPVEVKVSGDVDGLAPAVGAALYRIAQEAVTNAVRHARRASGVVVEVSVEDEKVRLCVSDDGEPVAGRGSGSGARYGLGYGIAGMTERATLLGGTLTAGPGRSAGSGSVGGGVGGAVGSAGVDGGGWVVKAVLPRVGSAP